MKALKWIGIGLGGFAGFVGVVVAVVFLSTSAGVTVANEFFALVERGKYEDAYRSTTPQFQKETSLDAFRTAMQRAGLDKFESASWGSREINWNSNETARSTLEGTIKTRDGRSVTVTVTLLKLGDTWRVHYVGFRSPGAS